MPSRLISVCLLLFAIVLLTAPVLLILILHKKNRKNNRESTSPENLAKEQASPMPSLPEKQCKAHAVTASLPGTALALYPGEKIGNFTVIEEINSGGMGKIIRAVSKKGQIVAVKIMKPEHCSNDLLVTRFQQELKIVSMLEHKNIAKILEWGVDDGRHYFAMEYVNGKSLRDLIESHSIPIEKAVKITEETCSALEYAHSKRVVHRDVKPENILLDSFGNVKVVDFGIARIDDNSGVSLTITNVAMGSPLYMSPEQKSDFRHVDHRADIYSLGVVLYEMLSGELPGGLMRLDLVPEGLRHIIQKSTAYSSDDRYPSISEMLADLARYEKQGSAPEDQIALDQIGENVKLRNVLIDVLYQSKAPDFAGIDLGFFYIPAGGVGGNYYDFIRIDGDNLGILVGNVFEKPDVKSAVFLTMIRSFFHIAAENEANPAETLKKVNNFISKESPSIFDRFAVFSYIVYNSGERSISVATAGYRPVEILNAAESKLKKIKSDGFGLGIMENSEFELKKIQLGIGDIVVLSSAGISDTKNLKGELFGEERLEEVILKNRHLEADGIVNEVRRELKRFSVGVAQQDDITLAIFKVIR